MQVNATIEKLPNDTAIVTLSGHLTLGTSLKLADSQINTAIAKGVTRMVIDLAAVDFVDSAGLGMLVYVYGTLNEKNGVLRLCSVAPRVLSLLRLTKTDTFLTIDPSRDESLAALAG
jgi:anti-sigma B factor antagonist